MPPIFEPSELGDIHPKIHKAMHQVLCSADIPIYLDADGRDLLHQVRATAGAAGIAENPIIEVGSNLVLFTWAGNRVTRTLSHLLKTQFALSCADDGFCIEIQKTTSQQLLDYLRELNHARMNAEDLCAILPSLDAGKYVPHLNRELQKRNALYKHFDLEGTYHFLGKISNVSDQSSKRGIS